MANRGNLGSCSANALAGEPELLKLKDKLPLTLLSRLSIYYEERVTESTVNSHPASLPVTA